MRKTQRRPCSSRGHLRAVPRIVRRARRRAGSLRLAGGLPATASRRAAGNPLPRAQGRTRKALSRIERLRPRAAAVLGMRIGCVLDRPTTATRRPKRRSRAQWESRVKCELLHTPRPPSSDILALSNRAIWGISVKLRIREGERQCLDW